MKIIWENKYNTGIEKVDEQHRKLVEIINRLILAQENKNNSEEVEKIFRGVVNYCYYHFTTEELAMQENNYHEYLIHKAKHDVFINKVNEFNAKYNRGNVASLFDTIDFLKDWLIHHILIEDKRYAPLMMGKF